MKVFAHRGITPGNRENTLDAFASSVAVGADGVELDVRRTADGALIVHHDPSVEGSPPIFQVGVSDLPAWVPLLDAALDVCQGIVVNIEIKNDPSEPGYDPTGRLAREVADVVSGRGGEMVVSCFDRPTLDAVIAATPEVPTAFLCVRLEEGVLDAVAAGGHRGINPHHLSVNADMVGRAHDRGLDVAVWTVDDPDRMIELESWGVDVIITNEIERGLAVIHGR